MITSLPTSLIKTAIAESFKAQQEFNEEMLDRYTEELRKVNGDLEPTVDCDGRLHAPADGYQSEDGHVFRKGQYIPTKTEYYKGSEGVKVRVKGQVFISALKQDPEFSDSLGKQWVDSLGVLTCNLYLRGVASGFSSTVEEVVSQVQDSYHVEVKEHTLDGKVAVTGTVVGFWQKHSDYGIQQGFNVTIDNDGATYSGTLPKALYDAEEGDTVSFIATFSEGSKSFKRPSKAKVLGFSEII